MLKKWIKLSNFAHEWVDDDYKKSATFRWENKTIYNKEVLYNKDNKDLVKLNGIGSLSFIDDMIKVDLNDDVEDLVPRPNCTISILLNNKDYRDFNRISLKIKPISIGFVNFYMHISFGNEGEKLVHAPSVIPNIWNNIIFELDDTLRDKVDSINITPFLFGTPPEALPEISFLIKDLYIEKVDADYSLGWELENRIAYSHVGYFVNSKKEAIVQNINDDTFYLYDENNNVVFSDKCKICHKDDQKYYIMDFSSYNHIGKYRLLIDGKKTELFEISNNPYTLSIWKSIQFLRTLRCGKEVEKVHSACHLNCRTKNSKNQSVPNFGGWHDAGDVSQFEICTAEMAEALIDLSNVYKKIDKDLSNRLLEEAKIGTDWLLQTIFPDGERALAVGYNMWRKNVLNDTNEGVKKSISEKGPFENFLSASCLIAMSETYKKIDKIYSDWCYRIAILDYNTAVSCYDQGLHTKRWGSNIDSVVSGIGASCAAKLYKITKEQKYLLDATKYGKIIIACQQQELPKWDIPLRGFFYEDIKHEKMLTYEHRGHEQQPIQGLIDLCNTFIDHEDFPRWDKSIKLYASYIKDSMKYSPVYNLLPAHIYDLNKFNMERFTIFPYKLTTDEALKDLQNQAKTGIRLNDDVYLRRFPVAIQRRGYHATLLSKTKAVSLIAHYLKDDSLKQIAINQLEWIMGKNPFSSSTMYGEGYNYHPLYVAYSSQLIGALPVGFKTKGHLDLPYWPTVNNAVFKEIWGHTTGKYLYIFVDLLK